MIWIFPLVLLIVFEGIADVLAKEWSLKQHSILWIFALSGYLIANTFWLFALKNGSGLGRGAVIFSLASEIIALILGLIFYHEHVNKLQMIGLLLAIVSLVLIFWEN